MSLISHEISRADNTGEISQFRSTLPIMQKQYQGKNEVVLYAENRGYPPTQNGDIRSLSGSLACLAHPVNVLTL